MKPTTLFLEILIPTSPTSQVVSLFIINCSLQQLHPISCHHSALLMATTNIF